MNRGDTVVISWEAAGATSCSASGPNGFEGSVPTSGSREVAILDVQGVYTLSCDYPDGEGGSQTRSNAVYVPAKSAPGGGSGSGALPAWSLGLLLLLGLRRRR